MSLKYVVGQSKNSKNHHDLPESWVLPIASELSSTDSDFSSLRKFRQNRKGILKWSAFQEVDKFSALERKVFVIKQVLLED